MSPETPDPEERIRDLLGEVGRDRPALPPDVRARLDARLAELVAEGRNGEDPATPGSPGTRRGSARPRRLLLAAAAAVIVLGAGGATVASLTGAIGGESSTSSAGGSTADKATSGDRGLAREERSVGPAGTGLPVVRPDHLVGDVRRVLRREPTGPTHTARPQASVPVVDCVTPEGVAAERVRPVLYDGETASLVVRPNGAGRRVVEVWSCSGETRLARATVPAR